MHLGNPVRVRTIIAIVISGFAESLRQSLSSMGIVLSTISRCCDRAIVKLRINRGLAKECRFAAACFDKLYKLC